MPLADTGIVWLRNDLRLHDHEPLTQALKECQNVVLAYCFDVRHFAHTEYEWRKTGAHRARFLLKSLAELDVQLKARGGYLHLTKGHPETEIAQLVIAYKASNVYAHQFPIHEEQQVVTALHKELAKSGVELKLFDGHTLIHPNDLPFEIAALPDIFTQYRKRVEQGGLRVRKPLPAPAVIPFAERAYPTQAMPTLSELGYAAQEQQPAPYEADVHLQGGEISALAHLKTYIWGGQHLATYKQTRNQMLGLNYSSKLSAWLSMGCLSPRWVYAEVQRFEREVVENESTYWLIFELLWRDYFNLVAAKFGTALFKPGGLKNLYPTGRLHLPTFTRWAQGQTGVPFIDASMRQLVTTGFMSNRGRQNVASFLCSELKQPWWWGAAWFEHLLIDYDPASNWGNWNYVAGIGNDPRPNRWFNILKQANDYDADGVFTRHYVPELASLPNRSLHTPWSDRPLLKNHNIRLGQHYPEPIVRL